MSLRSAPRNTLSDHWPSWMSLVGLLAILPLAPVRWVVVELEGWMSTVAIAAPWQYFSNQKLSDASAKSAEATSPSNAVSSSWILEAMQQAERPYLPPNEWARGASFALIPVSEVGRSASQLLLEAPVPLPARSPIFDGEDLIGFVDPAPSRARFQGSAILPVTSKEVSVAAHCQNREGATVRFLVAGDGTETLRVLNPSHRQLLEAGAVVKSEGRDMSGMQPPEGAILGVLELDARLARVDPQLFRVRPLWTLETLAEVAVIVENQTAGLRPIENTRRLPAMCAEPRLADPWRNGFLVKGGRERGFQPGMAISNGRELLGFFTKVGFGRSVARCLWDPGLRLPVLILSGEQRLPWILRSLGPCDDGIRLAGVPPIQAPGAIVVTNWSRHSVPAGLLLGTLCNTGDGWILQTELRLSKSLYAILPGAEQR